MAFENLFGDGGTPEERAARQKVNRSILDHISQDMARLKTGLGASDRNRLNQYLENVREIAAIPGVDVLFVGPSDLSVSMGIPGQMDAPELLAAFDAVIAAARENKISAAILASDIDRVEPLSARGFDFIAVGSDSSLLRGAARQASGGKF